ncbi:MAG TPA: hypothetical protein DEP35_10185, partial [Deltaproteobacteria bacterium]|nr:hypothetical protein [Deltaproteobacteria bacterium]
MMSLAAEENRVNGIHDMGG